MIVRLDEIRALKASIESIKRKRQVAETGVAWLMCHCALQVKKRRLKRLTGQSEQA
ncbi:hypothetical protein IZ6_24930 [Terrihabitans soli]|uniref:Uncharacterized protein n=1 Tax=Terrihabitans soli TaxID=708113 RepID=A0A6S6QYT7_9HYPH|nr:hypothetical protein IZ6_24930 [Terrihabitans soli]